MSISIQKNLSSFKEHLVAFSLTFFAHASELNLQHSINFLIAKVYYFTHHAARKTTKIYKQVITTEYKGRFFNDYVKVTRFIQA